MLSKTFIQSIIDKHNDQDNSLRLLWIQSANQTTLNTSNVYNPDNLKYPPIEVTEDGILFRKESLQKNRFTTNEIVTTILNFESIEIIQYFEEGNEVDRKTGKRIETKTKPVPDPPPAEPIP